VEWSLIFHLCGSAINAPRLATLPYGTVQVQVQVCFTSVCGQVQPLPDVALSNSVRHRSCSSSAKLFVRLSRKAVYERSHRSSQVFSSEH
jgi:hypothetical protein